MKKLELQSFGVQELDANEMREMSGGVFPFWVIGAGIYLFDQREKVKQGVKDAIHDLTHF